MAGLISVSSAGGLIQTSMAPAYSNAGRPLGGFLYRSGREFAGEGAHQFAAANAAQQGQLDDRCRGFRAKLCERLVRLARTIEFQPGDFAEILAVRGFADSDEVFPQLRDIARRKVRGAAAIEDDRGRLDSDLAQRCG